MEDMEIIDLFWLRSENAILETKNKYSRYLYKIALNILSNSEDCEECLNDTYLGAWNSIPPDRPVVFSAFLGKITRNLAINTYHKERRQKRGGGQTELVLHELEECITGHSMEEQILDGEITKAINRFLDELPVQDRLIFVRRYWFLESVGEIAVQFLLSETNIQTKLYRMRKKLRGYLEKEGIHL